MNTGTSQHVSRSKLSEVKGLFRNTVTSSDRLVISHFLLDAEEEMKGYDADMDRLRAAMHLLENKKNGLRKTMDKCRSLLAPIHRLPTEILTMIFSVVCQPNYLDPLIIPQALTLSWVCGRWREVLSGSASLWADLSISFRSWQEGGDFHRLQRIVPVFLNRSKSRPLNLDLFCGLANGEDAKRVLEMLFENRSRWQNITLYNTPANFTLQNEGTSDIHFPSLQVLEINSDDIPNPSIFKNSPALHTLAMRRALRLDLPWHQFKHLKLGSELEGIDLNFLNLFRQLSTLQLVIGNRLRGNYQNVLLSALTSLKIVYGHQQDLDPILRSLTLPAVTSLQLCHFRQRSGIQPDMTSLTDLFTRSACSIASLTLKHLPHKDDDILALLELMPTVSTLELKEEDVPDKHFISRKFLRHFVVDNERLCPTPTFLPRLTSLSLELAKDHLIEQDLLDVVTSRWIPDPIQAEEMGINCLSSVGVILHGEETGSELSSLWCFSAVGLKLRVWTTTNETMLWH